jgi:hypothetical protein
MTTTATATRTCNTPTKTGHPCRSTILDDDGRCFVHGRSASLLPEVARRAGIASGQARRELGKSVRERLREEVETKFEKVWAAFEAGLDDEDTRTRVAAATALLSEAYGRPPQAIIGDPDQPVAFVLDSLLARARAEVGG